MCVPLFPVGSSSKLAPLLGLCLAYRCVSPSHLVPKHAAASWAPARGFAAYSAPMPVHLPYTYTYPFPHSPLYFGRDRAKPRILPPSFIDQVLSIAHPHARPDRRPHPAPLLAAPRAGPGPAALGGRVDRALRARDPGRRPAGCPGVGALRLRPQRAAELAGAGAAGRGGGGARRCRAAGPAARPLRGALGAAGGRGAAAHGQEGHGAAGAG